MFQKTNGNLAWKVNSSLYTKQSDMRVRGKKTALQCFCNEFWAMKPAAKIQVTEPTVDCLQSCCSPLCVSPAVTGSSSWPSPVKSAEIDVQHPHGEKSGPNQGKAVVRWWTVASHVRVQNGIWEWPSVFYKVFPKDEEQLWCFCLQIVY